MRSGAVRIECSRSAAEPAIIPSRWPIRARKSWPSISIRDGQPRPEKAGCAGKKNADIRHVPVSQLKTSGFDLACALFNVVTYLGSREELDDFFKSVSARLAPDGVFFFDCWNGVAALKDPPRGKEFHCEHPDRRIECELTSETDFAARKTRLSYQITILDLAGAEIASGSHAFFQTLWTPAEITESLADAGLVPFQCCPSFRPGVAATKLIGRSCSSANCVKNSSPPASPLTRIESPFSCQAVPWRADFHLVVEGCFGHGMAQSIRRLLQ